jgi:hypothetical protein
MQCTVFMAASNKMYGSHSVLSRQQSGRASARYQTSIFFPVSLSAYSLRSFHQFPLAVYSSLVQTIYRSVALFLVTQMFDLPRNQREGSAKDFLQPCNVNVILFKAEDAFLFSLGTFKRIPLLDRTMCALSMESSPEVLGVVSLCWLLSEHGDPIQGNKFRI